jgi:hypothetical protein
MSPMFKVVIAAFFLIFLALCSVDTRADDTCSFYQAGMWSKHFKERGGVESSGRKPYNEVHKSLGCENILGSEYSITVYENSYNDVSVWAYKEFRKPLTKNLSYGWDYGVITGYRNSVAPMAFGAIDWEGEKVGVKVIMFWAGLAVQTKFRF